MSALGAISFASFIMELCVEKTDLLCRTCLCFVIDEDYSNILEDIELFDKYVACTSLKVDPLDEYPKNICSSCCEQIILFSDFKQMCSDTLGRFKDFLNSSTAKFLDKESLLLQEQIEYDTQKLDSNRSILQSEKYRVEDNSKQNNSSAKQETKDKSSYIEETQVRVEKYIHVLKDSKYVESDRKKLTDKTDLVALFEQKEKEEINQELNELHDESSSIKTAEQRKNNINLNNEAQTVQNSRISSCEKFKINNSTEHTEHMQQCVTSTQDDEDEVHAISNNEIELKSDNSLEEPRDDTAQNVNFEQEKKDIIDHKSQEAHHSKRVFFCKLCPKKFRKEERFQAHLRMHKGLKAYACTQCDKQFVRIITLHTHIEQHHSDTHVSYTCTYEGCTRVYNRKESLAKHINECHAHNTPTKCYMCEVCGKVFNRRMFLNRHRFVHMEKSSLPFECNECGKRFSKKLNLNYHLNRHAGIKNFICALCGMQKTTKSELQAHMNYHTLEKTWKCETCGKIFNTLGNLKLHMRTVHEGVRNYKCRYCDRKFGKAGTLKCHEMRHTGERPHKCKLCGHGFIQAVALRSHMKVHAKMDEDVN